MALLIAASVGLVIPAPAVPAATASAAADAAADRPKESEPLVVGAPAEGLSRRTYEVMASGSHAFAATTAGLTVYDISDPAKPRVLTSLHFPGSGNGLALSGNRIFLAMGPEGLRIIDVSNPAAPRLTGALETGGSVNGVAVVEKRAGGGSGGAQRIAIADGAGGVKIVEVSASGAARVVSSLDTGRYAAHVAARADLVAAAEEDDGVGLYRLSPEGALSQSSSSPLPGTVRGVAFSGNRVFAAAGLAGLITLDAANPARPRMIGSFPSKHYARGVHTSDGTIFLADSQQGIMLIQEGASDQRPAHRLLGRFDSGSSANRVSRSGRLALVAIDSGGIRLVDISDPSSPKGF